MSRIKKSAAEKKLAGTLKSRDKDQLENEQIISTTCFAEGTVLDCPEEITDEYVRQFFQSHTQQLIFLHLLSPSDLPELNLMYFTLQQIRQINKQLSETDLLADLDNYDKLTKMSIKLGNRFSELAKRYYVSPVARTRIQLDAATLQQKKQELTNPKARLLAKKIN